jgi:GMP synthase-like glutamine amidotransferase
MKPVAIFRFSSDDGPGYFATFLDRHSIPWTQYNLDKGDALPTNPDDFSGFVFMGGSMSVNDDLPWIPPVLALIRKAIAQNRPCIGHCLGGQLMCKALGGEVTRNPVKEIGWNPLLAENNAIARQWLGGDIVDHPHFTTFQWHGETFTLPSGSTRILRAEACDNQAFVIGNSLAMQCHVEMTPEMIEEWCGDWAAEKADPALPSVQRPEEMRAAMDKNMRALNGLADRLYGRWITGLAAS